MQQFQFVSMISTNQFEVFNPSTFKRRYWNDAYNFNKLVNSAFIFCLPAEKKYTAGGDAMRAMHFMLQTNKKAQKQLTSMS